jgi:hypothetical protein
MVAGISAHPIRSRASICGYATSVRRQFGLPVGGMTGRSSDCIVGRHRPPRAFIDGSGGVIAVFAGASEVVGVVVAADGQSEVVELFSGG